MDRKSEVVLTVILFGFFAVFMFRLPDSPMTDLKANTDKFSNYIATNYMPGQANNGPVYADINALTGIAPAAGDATVTPATATPSTDTTATTGTTTPAVDEKAGETKADADVKKPAEIVPEDTKADDKAAKKAAHEKAEDKTAPTEAPSEKPAQ